MSMSEREDCPHDNTEYDPGNYIPPFGWEQPPGTFCVDCGKEIEPEEIEYEVDDHYYDVDPITLREELSEEAGNPL